MECDATEHTLDNGLRVVLAEDRLAPIASVCLWYDVGSRHEKSGRTGLAHLFEHLMFQGSRNVPGNGHFELVQGAGGTLNGTTSFERTNYFETVPVNQLELMLWAEADRMGSLLDVLDQSSVDNQRDVVKNERRQRYDNVPYGTALERLVQNVFPAGHPYQHMPIGSMADLDAASLDDAREFFRTFYAPNNAVLSVVGDIDSRRVLNWVDRYFGSIESQPNSVPKKDGAIGPVIGEEIVESVTEDVPNPALFAGYRLPADGTAEADAAELATIIAGRGHASLLHNRLVRRDRSASSVELSMIRLAGTESIGVLEVMVTPGTDLDAVRTAVDDELAAFAHGGPSEEQLERARAQLRRSWLERTATTRGRADLLCRYATLFGSASLVGSVLPNLLAVPAEDVQSVAGQRFRPENRVLLEYRGSGERA